MPDVPFQPDHHPDLHSQPVLVPVMAEDVARRKRRNRTIIVAAVIALVFAGWFSYRRMVDPIAAQQAYTDGVRLYRANRYEQAVLNFTRAVDLKPDHVESYRMRGRAYALLGQPDAAIADFTKASALLPTDGSLLVERGFVYFERKDLTHAMADSTSALQRDEKLARAYNLRATIERSTGETRDAIEDFSRAVALDPNLDNYFQRAATYQLINDHQHALADFNEALNISPGESHTHFARAQSRAALGDYQGAKEDIEIGRRIDGW
jgi:tetratricopeptide (TPR) repeat protein